MSAIAVSAVRLSPAGREPGEKRQAVLVVFVMAELPPAISQLGKRTAMWPTLRMKIGALTMKSRTSHTLK